MTEDEKKERWKGVDWKRDRTPQTPGEWDLLQDSLPKEESDEGRWDYTEDNEPQSQKTYGYNQDEIERARLRMKAEKDELDKEEDLFTSSDKSMPYQKGQENYIGGDVGDIIEGRGWYCNYCKKDFSSREDAKAHGDENTDHLVREYSLSDQTEHDRKYGLERVPTAREWWEEEGWKDAEWQWGLKDYSTHWDDLTKQQQDTITSKFNAMIEEEPTLFESYAHEDEPDYEELKYNKFLDWFHNSDTHDPKIIERYGNTEAGLYNFWKDHVSEESHAKEESTVSVAGPPAGTQPPANIWDELDKQEEAEEFKPELQGKKIRILSGPHAGEIAEVTSVEIYGDSVSVNLEGNRYYNIDEGNYEVIGESKATESKWKVHTITHGKIDVDLGEKAGEEDAINAVKRMYFDDGFIDERDILSAVKVGESLANEERVSSDTYYYDYSDYWKKGDNYQRSGLALQADIPTSWANTEWDDLPKDIQTKIKEAGFVTSYEVKTMGKEEYPTMGHPADWWDSLSGDDRSFVLNNYVSSELSGQEMGNSWNELSLKVKNELEDYYGEKIFSGGEVTYKVTDGIHTFAWKENEEDAKELADKLGAYVVSDESKANEGKVEQEIYNVIFKHGGQISDPDLIKELSKKGYTEEEVKQGMKNINEGSTGDVIANYAVRKMWGENIATETVKYEFEITNNNPNVDIRSIAIRYSGTYNGRTASIPYAGAYDFEQDLKRLADVNYKISGVSDVPVTSSGQVIDATHPDYDKDEWQSYEAHKSGYIKCKKCDQEFSNLQYLQSHMKETHGGYEVYEKVEEVKVPEYKVSYYEFGWESLPVEVQEKLGSGIANTTSLEWNIMTESERKGRLEELDLKKWLDKQFPTEYEEPKPGLTSEKTNEVDDPKDIALLDRLLDNELEEQEEGEDEEEDIALLLQLLAPDEATEADDGTEWITVKGNHIPIGKGQNKGDAIKSFFDKKKSGGGGKQADKSDKDLIKAIKGDSEDYHDWGRNEKNEELYAEIERRNQEVPKPKRPEGAGDTIFRDDPDAVKKMEAKVKYLEDVQDYWKKIIKFPARDYHTRPLQLGDAKWFELSNVGANLRDARKKLEGIKAQQGRGTQLVRKPTYKDGSKRFYYSEEPKGEPAEEPWQKGGESYKKKATELDDIYNQFTGVIDAPTGKNIMDSTRGYSNPEADGQDLTGTTINEDVIEKKPVKVKHHYYKQYPFGRIQKGFFGEVDKTWWENASYEEKAKELTDIGFGMGADIGEKGNPLAKRSWEDLPNEARAQWGYYGNEVELSTMEQARKWWDNKFPDRQWKDMRIDGRQRAIMAFLRDPDTSLEAKEGKYDCQRCKAKGYNMLANADTAEQARKHYEQYHDDEDMWSQQESHANEVRITEITWKSMDKSSRRDVVMDVGFFGNSSDPLVAMQEIDSLVNSEWSSLPDWFKRELGEESYAKEKGFRYEQFFDWYVPYCNTCNKRFDLESDMIKHLKDEHGIAQEGGVGSGRKPYASKDPARKDKAHVGWKNQGIDDYLDLATKDYEQGKTSSPDEYEYAGYHSSKESVDWVDQYFDFEDDRNDSRYGYWCKKCSGGTFTMLENPDQWKGGHFESGDISGMVDHLVNKHGWDKKEFYEAKEYNPSNEELGFVECPECNRMFSEDRLEGHMKEEHDTTLADYSNEGLDDLTNEEQIAQAGHRSTYSDYYKDKSEEGGKGSGRKGHQQWMRSLEEDPAYSDCPNCQVITERVNGKCQMCGKKMASEGTFQADVYCPKCDKFIDSFSYKDTSEYYQSDVNSETWRILNEHDKKVHA